MSEPTLIPIDLIIRDPKLQSRVDPVDPDVAERYTTLYADGPTAMDAIEVYREAGAAGEGQVWLTDGWTRLAAAERAGLREILADIKAGTWRDALLASWEANGRHGARLTRADQRRKGEAIMSDPELAGQPLRALEHRFGVGRELLRTIQAELEAAGRSVRPATVVDSAGREQPTKKPRGRPPGSKNRPKSTEEEGLRYARGLRTEARGLLEELRDRDVETWDFHGEAQETSLWLEALDDTSVTELESALPVLRVRASLPGKPAPPAAVQQLPATDAPPVVAEVSSDAGDDGDDAEAAGEAAAADPPREPRPSTAESRPVRDLLCHLRDAGVERIGEGEESSWAVRGVLDRLDLGNVQHRELVQISAAAERAALQLRPTAAERRADSREDGRRRGKLIARLKQLVAEGIATLDGAPTEYLRQIVPTMSEEQLARVEGLAFPEPQPQEEDAVGALTVGAAEDVAELLNGMSVLAQVGSLREALERIGELEAELATVRREHGAAHALIARVLDLREGRIPAGWPESWPDNRWSASSTVAERRHPERGLLIAQERGTGGGRWGVELETYDLDGRDEAETTARLWAWTLDLLEPACPPSAPLHASPTSDTPPSSASEVEPAPASSAIVDVAEPATGPRAAARVLDEVPEQLRLTALLVGTLPDKDVSAATAQPLRVVRKLRLQLGWEASPRSLTTDELADQLRIYAAQDVAQLAYMLNVPPGERLTERLALELAGRMW